MTELTKNCDGLDQIVEEECADFEIVDCDGSCVPANWLGDGYCDNGNYQYNGVYVDLSCEEYSFDEGDCETLEEDNDGDGFFDYNDCDDNDPSINPGAIDIPNDGIDQNCDGVDATLLDGDGDGFTVDVDCDDDDANIYPTAPDIPGDGIDQNCDGVDAEGNDNDGDGFLDIIDCDDTDPLVYPGAPEIPADGVDQDCDGYDGAISSDTDGDGFDDDDDCQPFDPSIYPGKKRYLEMVSTKLMGWTILFLVWTKMVMDSHRSLIVMIPKRIFILAPLRWLAMGLIKTAMV